MLLLAGVGTEKVAQMTEDITQTARTQAIFVFQSESSSFVLGLPALLGLHIPNLNVSFSYNNA